MDLTLVEEIIYQLHIILNSYFWNLVWPNRKANAIQKKYPKEISKKNFQKGFLKTANEEKISAIQPFTSIWNVDRFVNYLRS